MPLISPSRRRLPPRYAAATSLFDAALHVTRLRRYRRRFYTRYAQPKGDGSWRAMAPLPPFAFRALLRMSLMRLQPPRAH